MEVYKDARVSLTTLPQSTQRLSWTHKEQSFYTHQLFTHLVCEDLCPGRADAAISFNGFACDD